MRCCLLGLALVVAGVVSQANTERAYAAERPVELRDGDRVVFLGSATVEQAQHNDYLETALTARYPDRQISFRNLGWSGDTVFGDARAGFDTAEEGYERLITLVRDLKPTVIFFAYGGNESFAGPAGLENFEEGLDHLLNDLGETGARIVIVTPAPFENLGPPLPDPTQANENLKSYSKVLKRAASARDVPLVDVFALMSAEQGAADSAPMTDDTMHLTDYGYWCWARAVTQGLGWQHPVWSCSWSRKQGEQSVEGLVIDKFEASGRGARFNATDSQLPPLPQPAPPAGAPARPQFGTRRVIRFEGLEPGTYTLKIDGKEIHQADADEWKGGVELESGPDFEQAEALRGAILAKNQLYFHRWRPQNETYLFGFRKHEQGNNAVEIPQFDPLVVEREALIAQLRVPVAHEYELSPLEGSAQEKTQDTESSQ